MLAGIEAAGSAEEIYDILREPDGAGRTPEDPETLEICRPMMRHAEAVAEEFEVLLALRSELESGDITPHVFHRVLPVAPALARQGREGKPIGTIFIPGDYQNVRRHCYQLVIDPLQGCRIDSASWVH